MTMTPIPATHRGQQLIAARYVCLTDSWGSLLWIDINDDRVVLNLVDVVAHAEGEAVDAVKAHVDALHSTLAATFDWALHMEMHAAQLAQGHESFGYIKSPAWQLAAELKFSIESHQQAVDDLASLIAGLDSPVPTREWPFEPWLLWRDAAGDHQDLPRQCLDTATCQRLGIPAVLARATCVLAQLRHAEREMRTLVEGADDSQPSGN